MRKFNITVNGNTYEVDVEEITGGVAQAAAPVAAAPVAAAPAAAPAAPKPAAAPKAIGEGTKVTAPMPGTIVGVKVKAGDSVKKGDLLVILEAMKMENEIFASVDGTVTGVSVSQGDSVNTGDALVSIA